MGELSMIGAWHVTDNDAVVVEDPHIGGSWWNYLFNPDTYLKVDGHGNGPSWSRQPRIQQWGRGGRQLWIGCADG